MIHPNANDTLTVRSVFIIDPNKKVRLVLTYPASTGRNFAEILRTIDSLQLTDTYKVATSDHYALLHNLEAAKPAEVESRLKRLEDKRHADRLYFHAEPQRVPGIGIGRPALEHGGGLVRRSSGGNPGRSVALELTETVRRIG